MGKINAFLNVSLNIIFRFNLTFKYRFFFENEEHQRAILNLWLKAQVFISTAHLDPEGLYFRLQCNTFLRDFHWATVIQTISLVTPQVQRQVGVILWGTGRRSRYFLLNRQELQTSGWGYQLVIYKAQLRVVCRPSFHTLWEMRLCPSPGGGDTGSWDPFLSRGRENRGPDWVSKERLEEEHPSLLVGLKSDHSMAKVLFEGVLNRLTNCESLAGPRKGQDQVRDSTGLAKDHRRGLPGWGQPNPTVSQHGGVFGAILCPFLSQRRKLPRGEPVLGHTGQSHT